MERPFTFCEWWVGYGSSFRFLMEEADPARTQSGGTESNEPDSRCGRGFSSQKNNGFSNFPFSKNSASRLLRKVGFIPLFWLVIGFRQWLGQWFADLQDNDAILVCTGAMVPRDLSIANRDAKGICFAMQFLEKSQRIVAGEEDAWEGLDAKGKRVIVLGGGDTATDCIATCTRLVCFTVTAQCKVEFEYGYCCELLVYPSQLLTGQEDAPLHLSGLAWAKQALASLTNRC